jgi:hypothetical protein
MAKLEISKLEEKIEIALVNAIDYMEEKLGYTPDFIALNILYLPQDIWKYLQKNYYEGVD